MTDLYDPGPQSGGRRPAPGRLALVQAFVNTFYELEDRRGEDHLATEAGLAEWLEERGLDPGEVTVADLRRALAVREGLRALLYQHNDNAPDAEALGAMHEAADELPVTMRVDPEGEIHAAPAGPGVPAALGLVLVVVHEAQADGTWRRLKACPGRHCGWAFYDYSVNRTSTWCSMQVCGGREKARAYRQRVRSRDRD
jgi:predicted RNA-binding Zn ribbon-like protein